MCSERQLLLGSRILACRFCSAPVDLKLKLSLLTNFHQNQIIPEETFILQGVTPSSQQLRLHPAGIAMLKRPSLSHPGAA